MVKREIARMLQRGGMKSNCATDLAEEYERTCALVAADTRLKTTSGGSHQGTVT